MEEEEEEVLHQGMKFNVIKSSLSTCKTSPFNKSSDSLSPI
jgi:hypothetical protein